MSPPNAEPRSEAERRLGLAPGAFPVNSRFLDIAGARLHAVDEGRGPAVLMLHGNPTWSFLFRHLIAALRTDYRCVALDLAGFGLSQAPPGFSFRPEDHAPLVARALEALDVRDATLVAHDWGGPIGLAAMAATDGRITRLCLGNTWAWPVNGDLHFEWFSRLMGGAVGRWAASRFAPFVTVLLPWFGLRRRRLTPVAMAAYRAPFAQREARRPLHIFPAAITGSGAWLAGVERTVAGFHGPARLIWPAGDFAFREKERRHWQRLLPQADVVRVPRCGHYLWEDAPEECRDAVAGFLAAQGGPASASASAY